MDAPTESRAMHPRMPSRVEIIDCTLRDGEQAPGVWFSIAEKLRLAEMLSEAGVDVLDAGFPASSGEDVEALQELRRSRLRARVGATARPLPEDIAAAVRARAEEIFLFLATSDLRLAGMRLTREAARARLRAGVELAASHGLTLNVVAEDAYRADPAFLVSLIEALARLPVKRFIICDTVGAAFPAGMERLIQGLHSATGGAVGLVTHCHNDFGMATANSLAAVTAGATGVTCTVNGMGERAGNADLAETVAALTHILGVQHGVEPSWLPRLSAEVELLSGIHTGPLKPVTGWNVYSHESGIHVDAMLKDTRSYEFLPAQWTGRMPRFVLGKLSGTALVRHILREHGVSFEADELPRLLAEVKRLAQGRSKDDYPLALERGQAFFRRALGGVDPERLLELARSWSTTRQQVGS